MPLVSQTFDQLLDFTRTTSGTFVGSNGLIQTTPASVNLLTWTQQFDNVAWSKGDATVAANATTAPDGTSTADKLQETTANAPHYALQAVTVAAAAHTASVYVKAAERTWCILEMGGTPFGCGAWFNLSTGVVGTQFGSPSSVTITAVGNGWWRLTMTKTAGSSGSAFTTVYTSTGDNVSTYAGTAGSGIFVWGAQLEAASAASTYTRNNGGVFPPRFDYDPVTLAPKGLLIEEQRTNVVLTSTFATLAGSAGSQYPSGTGWSNFFNTGGTRTYVSSSVFAGAQAMDVASVSAARNVIGFSFAAASSTTYTVSFYVESVSGATGIVAYATGALGTGGTTNSVTAPTTTGRYTYTFTTGTGAGTVDLRFGIGAAANESGSIRISNVQCEAGAFATSYIPTVASQVTRTADQCSIVAPNFAPWYNQSEGSFVFEGSILGDKGATTVDFLQASDGVSNSISIDLGMFGVAFPFFAVSNTTGQANLGLGTLTLNSPFKMAGAYKTNDFAGVLNGGTVQTDTSGTVPTGIAQLGLGNRLGGVYMNGHIRSVRYYPTRLSNAQIQALTA